MFQELKFVDQNRIIRYKKDFTGDILILTYDHVPISSEPCSESKVRQMVEFVENTALTVADDTNRYPMGQFNDAAVKILPEKKGLKILGTDGVTVFTSPVDSRPSNRFSNNTSNNTLVIKKTDPFVPNSRYDVEVNEDGVNFRYREAITLENLTEENEIPTMSVYVCTKS